MRGPARRLPCWAGDCPPEQQVCWPIATVVWIASTPSRTPDHGRGGSPIGDSAAPFPMSLGAASDDFTAARNGPAWAPLQEPLSLCEQKYCAAASTLLPLPRRLEAPRERA